EQRRVRPRSSGAAAACSLPRAVPMDAGSSRPWVCGTSAGRHTKELCVLLGGDEDPRSSPAAETVYGTRSSSSARELGVALSIDPFAPTPAAKLGLALDLAVLATAMAVSTPGPWWLRAGWIGCALGVSWTTSSVAKHYWSMIERAWWEDLLFTA